MSGAHFGARLIAEAGKTGSNTTDSHPNSGHSLLSRLNSTAFSMHRHSPGALCQVSNVL